MSEATGARLWAISGGFIPVHSRGREPEFTSRDQLSVLNAGIEPAALAITIYYSNREPVGPYELTVGARRVRRLRVNDLIFPEAIELGIAYALVIRSDRSVVVQFTRLDSGGDGRARIGGIAAHP